MVIQGRLLEGPGTGGSRTVDPLDSRLERVFSLHDLQSLRRVELSATRFCVATKTPDRSHRCREGRSAVRQGQGQYPNQWRAITKNAAGQSRTRPAAALFRSGLLCQGDPLDQAGKRHLRGIPPGLLRTAGMVRRGREPHACRTAEDHPLRGEGVPRQARQGDAGASGKEASEEKPKSAVAALLKPTRSS